MLIILETSRKEELHNWHAADRRYPLLMMPTPVAAVQFGDHEIQLYQRTVGAIIQTTQRRVLQERADRHADNT